MWILYPCGVERDTTRDWEQDWKEEDTNAAEHG